MDLALAGKRALVAGGSRGIGRAISLALASQGVADWASREAFTRFERSPEQVALTAPTRELRESASMAVMEVVEHVERSQVEQA